MVMKHKNSKKSASITVCDGLDWFAAMLKGPDVSGSALPGRTWWKQNEKGSQGRGGRLRGVTDTVTSPGSAPPPQGRACAEPGYGRHWKCPWHVGLCAPWHPVTTPSVFGARGLLVLRPGETSLLGPKVYGGTTECDSRPRTRRYLKQGDSDLDMCLCV